MSELGADLCDLRVNWEVVGRLLTGALSYRRRLLPSCSHRHPEAHALNTTKIEQGGKQKRERRMGGGYPQINRYKAIGKENI